ncbi:MAG: hypothetical protein K0R17_2926 [Rariglobus sp.]|jgi:predicted Zn-dependent protease|nr:hypothetical protein [Rariglobus sp.]
MSTGKDESPPPLAGTLMQKLVKTALLALVCLVLWGGVDLREIWLIAGLVLLVRIMWLIKALAHHERSPFDLGLEALSLIVVVPCAMLLVLMLTANIVAFTGIARWPIATSLVAAIALHFGPGLIKAPLLRGYYRTAIAFVMLAATVGVMQARHPYLLATGPAKRRLVAEKVWNLGHTFEASRHADKLFAYAEDLIAEGRPADAVTVLERGLSFDAYNEAARQRLASISQKPGSTPPQPESSDHRSSTSLWIKSENLSPIAILPTPPPEGFSIVLVPCGTIPGKVLDRVAAEVSARIELPVYRYHTSLALPPPDRSFGLIGNRQWHPASLWARFTDTAPANGGCQYILVTAEDIFIENTNFVFGTRIDFHGLVSYARFGNPDRQPADDDLLIDRLAKQVLSTSIKGFGIASRTTDCVTTISRNLEEFDRKAQVPSPDIRRDYFNAIRTLESRASGSAL